MITFLAVIYAIVSVLLIIVVMIQSGKGSGMGIFGGGGGSTFGAQSGDILTKITTILGVLFFGIALFMGVLISGDDTISKGDKVPSSGKERIFAPGTSSTNVISKTSNVSIGLDAKTAVAVKTNK